MPLTSFFRWLGESSSRRASRSTKSHRPALESLEDRSVPATLVALTATRNLLTFDSAAPNVVLRSVKITGIPAADTILGIDSRPSTGLLYASTNKALFQLDVATGVATRVSTYATATPKVAPSGFDFNPILDRVRLVNSTGQNIRITPDGNGLLVDAALKYETPGGPAPYIAGAAYDNPDNLPNTGSTLFGIDAARNTLVRQRPANNGTLQTIGALGFDVTGAVGFDIGPGNAAFASMNLASQPNVSRLYTINLTTGAATAVGTIGVNQNITGLAVLLPAQPIYAVTSTNQLVTFNAAAPEIITSSRALTGLSSGERILGMDFRPSTGELFASSNLDRLYKINISTGAVTKVQDADLPGGRQGFDFNPVADALRVVSEADGNVRIPNGGSGTLVNDGNLDYPTGDTNANANPVIVGSAYNNSFPGATTTILYGIDSNVDVLVTQNPNTGELTTVGSLGVNASSILSFDISAGNTAYAVIQIEGQTTSRLYTINLTSGAATAVIGTAAANDGLTTANEGIIGAIRGGTVTIDAMAIAPPTVQLEAATGTVSEAAGSRRVVVFRSGDTTSAITIGYDFTAQSATTPADFDGTPGLLSIQAGSTAGSFEVPIMNDSDDEPNETLLVKLTKTASDAYMFNPALDEMILTILDNDPA